MVTPRPRVAPADQQVPDQRQALDDGPPGEEPPVITVPDDEEEEERPTSSTPAPTLAVVPEIPTVVEEATTVVTQNGLDHNIAGAGNI